MGVILMLELRKVTSTYLELDHVLGIVCLYPANDISFHNINRLDVVLRCPQLNGKEAKSDNVPCSS